MDKDFFLKQRTEEEIITYFNKIDRLIAKHANPTLIIDKEKLNSFDYSLTENLGGYNDGKDIYLREDNLNYWLLFHEYNHFYYSTHTLNFAISLAVYQLYFFSKTFLLEYDFHEETNFDINKICISKLCKSITDNFYFEKMKNKGFNLEWHYSFSHYYYEEFKKNKSFIYKN